MFNYKKRTKQFIFLFLLFIYVYVVYIINLNYPHNNNSLIKKSVSLNKKLLLSFKNFIDFKKINFSTSELSALDTLSLVKIICVISPLDYLIKQMMLEFNNVDELCENLISVLEIEINNKNNNFKVN